MPTLADIRKAREAGEQVQGYSIAAAFGGDAEPKKHRRNKGRRIPRGSVGSQSNTAVNLTQRTSAELRAQRTMLQHRLQASEWDWEKDPTITGALALASLRSAISHIEMRLVEAQEGGEL